METSCSPDEPVVYCIDAEDRLCAVNEGWRQAAVRFEADALVEGALGRSLWSFIGSAEIESIYRDLLSAIRKSRRPAHFHYRCDDARWFRDMVMEITPLDEGHVEFRSIPARLAARAPQADRESHPTLLRVCGWCGRGQTAAGWQPLDRVIDEWQLFRHPAVPPSSHGICDECRQRLLTDFQNR